MGARDTPTAWPYFTVVSFKLSGSREIVRNSQLRLPLATSRRIVHATLSMLYLEVYLEPPSRRRAASSSCTSRSNSACSAANKGSTSDSSTRETRKTGVRGLEASLLGNGLETFEGALSGNGLRSGSAALAALPNKADVAELPNEEGIAEFSRFSSAHCLIRKSRSRGSSDSSALATALSIAARRWR
jgi:hypothetical protein